MNNTSFTIKSKHLNRKSNALPVPLNNTELFTAWLSERIDSFNYKPIIVEENAEKLILQIEGIISRIKCVVSSHFIDVCYEHSEGRSDILYEIDMPSAIRTTEGLYSCQDCKNPANYTTMVELIEKHSFELLLKWVNEIKSEDVLSVMDASEYGFFCAELGHQKKEWNYKDIKPIFIYIIEGIQ